MLAISRDVGQSVVIGHGHGAAVVSLAAVDARFASFFVSVPGAEGYSLRLTDGETVALAEDTHMKLVSLGTTCVLGFDGDRSVPVWRAEVLLRTALPNMTRRPHGGPRR